MLNGGEQVNKQDDDIVAILTQIGGFPPGGPV